MSRGSVEKLTFSKHSDVPDPLMASLEKLTGTAVLTCWDSCCVLVTFAIIVRFGRLLLNLFRVV